MENKDDEGDQNKRSRVRRDFGFAQPRGRRFHHADARSGPATLQPCNYMVVRECKANNGFPYRSVEECIDIESSYVCPGWEPRQWPF